MYSLIAFADHWGSRFGGINSFNTDFLSAFGVAFHTHVQIICIVTEAEEKEIEDAKNSHVKLVKLPYPPKNKIFTKEQAIAAVKKLNEQLINFIPEHTIWLGHDRISGEAAIIASEQAGGRSALIHHMSYNAYEALPKTLTPHMKRRKIKKTYLRKQTWF